MIFLENKKDEKIKKIRYTLALIISIVGLLCLIGIPSYAILKGKLFSSNEQIIRAGSVELSLTEYYSDMNGDISVMNDKDGLDDTDTYDFVIKNIGSEPATYDVKLFNEAPSDFSGNLLKDEYIKVGLLVNDKEMGPMSLKDVENVIDSNTLNKKELVKYKLRIWIDKKYESELLKEDNYKAFLKIAVSAKQSENLDNN